MVVRPALGEVIGVGRTSHVYAWGADAVVKVPHDDVPDEWVELEVQCTTAAAGAGLPVAAVRDTVRVGGRLSIVLDRIHGLSMWQRMVEVPEHVEPLARELAAMHRHLLCAGLPPGIPDFVKRIQGKITLAGPLKEGERSEAGDLARDLPRGAALLHGDLHPGNVLVGPDGLVVIDWFDASIGHPIADIVRSSMLIRPGSQGAPTHLPGATPEILGRLHAVYVAEFVDELEAAAANFNQWQAVVAAGRLAEGAEADEQELLDLWECRAERHSPD